MLIVDDPKELILNKKPLIIKCFIDRQIYINI